LESRIVKVYDYKNVDISSFQKVFNPNEDALLYELNRLVQKHISWAEGEEVHAGDMVVCSLQSDIQKFNKENIKFVVDSGMFHRELEKALIGMKKNVKKTIVLDNATVIIEVKAVTYRIVPPITNEMVQALSITDVTTVETYRNYLIQEQKKNSVFEDSYPAVSYVMELADAKSDLILKQTDWNKIVELELERNRVLAKQEELILEEMTKEDFVGKIPVASYQELVALVQRNAWDTLIHYLLGLYYAGQDGYSPDKEAYLEFIKEYAKSWNISEDQAKKSNVFEYYQITSYCGYYYKKIQEHVYEIFYRVA
jgi:FKBP-type peptidyl-prolyl cis-trans isomerase (trigger factor)